MDGELCLGRQGYSGSSHQVMSKWKPALVYSNGPWKKRGMWPDVFLVNSQEKDWHPMQQPLEEAEMFVKYFSQPGDIVVDCCAGSFTTAAWLAGISVAASSAAIPTR